MGCRLNNGAMREYNTRCEGDTGLLGEPVPLGKGGDAHGMLALPRLEVQGVK